MPRAKKKTAAKSTTGKINKSAWIREQPGSMSAKEVVEQAAKAGIKLTPTQVYTARATAKKAATGTKAVRPPKSAVAQASISDLSVIRRAVFEHGFGKVEAYLDELKRSVGL